MATLQSVVESVINISVPDSFEGNKIYFNRVIDSYFYGKNIVVNIEVDLESNEGETSRFLIKLTQPRDDDTRMNVNISDLDSDLNISDYFDFIHYLEEMCYISFIS